MITDLVETVSDEREDEETSEGGQEPDPPGDAGLAWLAGDDGGGDAVGLNTPVSPTQESLSQSYLESQMSLVNQERKLCDSCDQLGGYLDLLSVVLGKRE